MVLGTKDIMHGSAVHMKQQTLQTWWYIIRVCDLFQPVFQNKYPYVFFTSLEK